MKKHHSRGNGVNKLSVRLMRGSVGADSIRPYDGFPYLNDIARGNGVFRVYLSLLSLLIAALVPADWKIWTITISRMTATYMTRYL